jgi:hypothetical protein
VSGPLPPRAALARAARLLEASGFREVARGARGDSLYLARPGCPWHLRLSNHARSVKQRRRRTDVLTSLVVDAPRSEDQVAALVRSALGNFDAQMATRAIPARRDG